MRSELLDDGQSDGEYSGIEVNPVGFGRAVIFLVLLERQRPLRTMRLRASARPYYDIRWALSPA